MRAHSIKGSRFETKAVVSQVGPPGPLSKGGPAGLSYRADMEQLGERVSKLQDASVNASRLLKGRCQVLRGLGHHRRPSRNSK
jgi:hypothetical protein